MSPPEVTPAARAWLLGQIERLSQRLAARPRGALAAHGDRNIAACLDLAIAGMQARLDAALQIPATTSEPLAAASAGRNPIFWRNGRYTPFAGTRRDQLLDSAATLRRLGAEAAARRYEQLAEVELTQVFVTRPPDPFTAGPQLRLL